MSTATKTRAKPVTEEVLSEPVAAEPVPADTTAAEHYDLGLRLYRAGRGPQRHAYGKPDWPHDWHYLRTELIEASGIEEEVATLVQEAKARADAAWRQTDAYQAGLALEQGIAETVQALAEAERLAARSEADYRAATASADEPAALAAKEQARKARDMAEFRGDQLANRRAKLKELESEQRQLLRQLHQQERAKLLDQVQPRVEQATIALGKAAAQLVPEVALDVLIGQAYWI
jgi:hypothetical protein